MTCEDLKFFDQPNVTMTNDSMEVMCRNVSGEFNENIFDTEIRRTQELPLIESNYWLAMVYIGVMAVALLTGTAGNCIILLVSACYRSVRRTGYQFIVNLALADLCVAAIADPMCIVAVVKGEAWFNDKPWLCTTVASMCITSCFCAFFNLLMASLNRYVCICHHALYYRIFSNRNCIAMCVGAWFAAFLAQFPNLAGWGDHGYDKKSHQCIWDRTASFSYTLIVSVGLIGSPLCIMGVSYFLTFKKIYSTKVNLYTMDKDDPYRVKKIWRETAKSSKMLFVIFVLFVFLWVPYAVVISVDVHDHLPVAVHLLVTMFAHLHSSVNCLIYWIGNRKFRSACQRLFKCSKCRESAIISDSRSTGNSGGAGLGSGVVNAGKISTIVGSEHFKVSQSTSLNSDEVSSDKRLF